MTGRRKLLLWLGTALTVVCVVPVAVTIWIGQSTRRLRYSTVADVPPRRVALIFGAGVYPSGKPSDVLADRLQTALELFGAGKVQLLVLSGGVGSNGRDEIACMRDWCLHRGVPAAALRLDPAGARTLESLRNLAAGGETGAILVTQRFHLPRALYLARRLSLDAVGLEADRQTYLGRHQFALRESLALTRAVLEPIAG